MAITAPLDLQFWLVNTLSGSWNIFLFIAAIAIALIGMRFRMPNMIFGVIIFLFIILINQWVFWPYVVAVIIFLMIIAYQIYKSAAR